MKALLRELPSLHFIVLKGDMHYSSLCSLYALHAEICPPHCENIGRPHVLQLVDVEEMAEMCSFVSCRRIHEDIMFITGIHCISSKVLHSSQNFKILSCDH